MQKHEGKISLEQTEHWMQTVIMHRGNTYEAVESEKARVHIDIGLNDLAHVISETGSLSRSDGLGIYRHAYGARLVECLEKEFTVLMKLMGKELFDAFALDYLQTYPPRSFTMADLGKEFPRFLEETRPANADWSDLIIDLTSLERAFSEVFDARCEDAERLLACRYPVHEYFTAMRSGAEPEPPTRRKTYLLVHRPDEVVRFRELSRKRYERLRSRMSGIRKGT